MISEASEKKGGPYTKNEKEQRQNEVYRLHIEHGDSAVKIAETLNVSRNTVNEDIKKIYSMLSENWKSCDMESWMMKQLERLESQRGGLVEDLEKEQESKNRISFRKQLFDIDNKITQIITKTMPHKKEVPATDETQLVTDDLVEEIIHHLIGLEGGSHTQYKRGEMIREIIKFLKCDVLKASRIIGRMESLGLGYCEEPSSENTSFTYYNLSKFSEIRGIN